jgi:hypothetical protein
MQRDVVYLFAHTEVRGYQNSVLRYAPVVRHFQLCSLEAMRVPFSPLPEPVLNGREGSERGLG